MHPQLYTRIENWNTEEQEQHQQQHQQHDNTISKIIDDKNHN